METSDGFGQDVRVQTRAVGDDLEVHVFRSSCIEAGTASLLTVGEASETARRESHSRLLGAFAALKAFEKAPEATRMDFFSLDCGTEEGPIEEAAEEGVAAAVCIPETQTGLANVAVGTPPQQPPVQPVAQPAAQADQLSYLRCFLRRRLFGAFDAQAPPARIDVHLEVGEVSVGGSGARWHQDGLRRGGRAFDYVALYYLEPTAAKGQESWLEVLLDDTVLEEQRDRAQLRRHFLPVSTAALRLLVLRNEKVFHRTPLLVPLKVAGGAPTTLRRFFWLPFSAFDARGEKVWLENPPCAACEPAAEAFAPLSTEICAEVRARGMDVIDYIDPDGAPATKDEEDEAMGWMFEEPEDSES